MAGARPGMCELTHCMTEEWHGNGMDAAWARHAICESAFTLPLVGTVIYEECI